MPWLSPFFQAPGIVCLHHGNVPVVIIQFHRNCG
jgi:hypothetical protein